MNSNESSNAPSLQAVLDRLAAMEAHLAGLSTSSMDTSSVEDNDPAIVERPALTDLHPPEDFVQFFPQMGDDFFRRPMDEVERRQFLQSYPRNVLRQYDPPVTNTIKLGNFTKKFDSQLSNIQFRLSGLTRPIDAFLYDMFRNQSETVPVQVAKDFAVCMHEMLADVASHITQLRSDNVCADNKLPSVPLVPPQRDPGLLLDAPRIIEQSKLRESLSDISSSQRRNRSKKRNGSSKPSQSTETGPTAAPSSSDSSNPNKKKDFRKGQSTQPQK